ncbi:S1C family serine protease [[Clostridium] colinum]|uniref:S1C family serine protease n=1 Tax=[Clostridium] colinum TaxID=36835 RepID=UPI002024E434|nr:trypsin-like peptidase domain-containing protein [[Clostridium] colinum]
MNKDDNNLNNNIFENKEIVENEANKENNINNVENTLPDIHIINNKEQIIDDMEMKKENIKDIINKEKLEKKEKDKNKRKKATKVILKSGAIASCCLFLGVGIGAGAVVSKNFISKREQSSFKFDTNDLKQSSLKDNIILTSNSASSIFKEVGDSVVNISTKVSGGFFGSNLQDLNSGSGIIYKIDGDKVYIVTNNHVIEGASYVTISVTGEEQVEASLVGMDPSSDLAVLSVSKQDMHKAGIKNITVAKFVNSDTVEVGDFVFPIGNALGRGKTMTQGMISAQNKQINIDGKNLTVLQTDAAINPGNSGGALMNTEGEVVGINTAKLSSSAIEGIGYAIPSNIAIDIVEQIINNGYVERPYFGIMGKSITENTKRIYGLNVDGVIVVEVEDDSNADKAGLKPGDIITSFNGKDVKTVEDLSSAINSCKANDTVSFDIIREGSKQITLTVVLAPNNTSF